MKKISKRKLDLQRETIVPLLPADLDGAVGGQVAQTDTCFWTGTCPTGQQSVITLPRSVSNASAVSWSASAGAQK